MFERAFDVAEYESRTPFTAAGLRVTAVPVVHYDVAAHSFRVEGDRVLAYSGDSGPCSALEELARDADLSSARRRSRAASSTARSVGISPWTRWSRRRLPRM